MLSAVALCRDLFLLAHAGPEGSGASRGHAWERMIEAYFAAHGVSVEILPGGCRILGHFSLSGLRHQVDAAVHCLDAIVIGEWKAHRGPIPKNELLRFKAVTDDYYLAFQSQVPWRPILRVFGGAGGSNDGLRAYAAGHGIVLIDRERWPVPFLASDRLLWPGGELDGPTSDERRVLAAACRPMQQVLVPEPDGSFRMPRPWTSAQLSSMLRLHDTWSDLFWESLDREPGAFESLVANVGGCGVAA